MTKYRWISARKAEGFPVTAACAIAQVPRASYYEFCVRAAQPTNAELDEALFINEILNVHRFHDDTYGSPRMTAELRRRGFCANHKRIERLMAANGICARDGRRRRVRTTISSLFDPQLPDLVQRDFSVGRPGERSCGDITYIATSEGWLYLADVMDLGSRRVIGFAMAERMPTELVAQALEMAATTRDGDLMGMIFHHDRGSQYLSGDFQRLCRRLGVRQSVGRVGSSYDNAAAESFWATLKRELISRFHFATRDEAKRAITAWIHHYNTVRLHSSIGNVPPIEWELRFICNERQAA